MPAIVPALIEPLQGLVREAGEASSSCGSTCLRNWKIGFSALLIAEGIIFAYLIFFLRRFLSKSPGFIKKVSVYSHAVSGGIFLATAFMHLLPETLELFGGGHGDEHGGHGDEHAGHADLHGEHGDEHAGEHGDEHHDDHGHGEGEEHDEGEEDTNEGPFDTRAPSRALVRALTKLATRQEEGHDDHGHEDEHGDAHGDEHGGHEGHKFEFSWAMFTVLMAFFFLMLLDKIIVPALLRRTRKRIVAKVGEEEADKVMLDEHGHAHGHDHGEDELRDEGVGGDGKRPGVKSLEFLVSLVSVVALSIHVVFENIALGLGSSFATILNVFTAVASHRWAFALAISIPLSKRVNHFAFAILIGIFTIVIPIGTVIGALVSTVSNTAKGIMFAISTGAFIYLGAVECLGEAFEPGHKFNRPLLFVTAMLGAGFLFAVTGILAAAGVEHAD